MVRFTSVFRSFLGSKPTRRRSARRGTSLGFEGLEDRALMSAAPVPAEVRIASAPVEAPKFSLAQQQNLAKLKSDLAAIKEGNQVTPEQIEQLKNDIVTLVKGTTKPSQESVATLKADLKTSLEDGKLTNQERIKLASDVKAVLASANVPIEEVQAVVADVKAILDSTGISKDTLATIKSDLEAIRNEFQANHGGPVRQSDKVASSLVPGKAPLISEAQKQNLAKLKSDLAAIKAGSQVTPEQIEQLKNDIVTLVKGTTKPSQESVATLKADLKASLADGKLTNQERIKLTSDVKAVLASANVPIEEVQAVVTDVKAILDSTGISKDTLATFKADLDAIRDEFWANHQ